MPLLDYKCPECKKEFSELVKNCEQEVLCPDCKNRHHMLFLPHRYDGTKVLRVFRPDKTPDPVLHTPMYFLGFDTGGFLDVVLPDGSIRYFTLEEDIGILHRDLFLP